MEYTTRIMGYSVTFVKPQECSVCHISVNINILEHIVDNNEGSLRYILILKCPSCHELMMAKYHVGKESELKNIQESSNTDPIESLANDSD